jgi:hypothetical protein
MPMRANWPQPIRGISIEQFFQREPERYKQYRRLVLDE